MQLWDDLLRPADVTAYLRILPDANPDNLGLYLPTRLINGIKSRVVRTTRTKTTARYRSYNAETPIGDRPWTVATTDITLPPLGQKLALQEWEQLQLQAAQVGVGAISDQIKASIYDDASNAVAAIRNRIALARGDFLTDGKFTLTAENGLTMEYDAGLPTSHKPTAGTLWSNTTTSTPLSDEIAWNRLIRVEAQSPPTWAVAPIATVDFMRKNAEYKAAYWGGATVQPTLTLNQLNEARAANGLPPLAINDATVSVDGTVTRLLPANKFLTGNDQVGETQMGITAQSLNLVRAGVMTFADAPGIYGGVYAEEDPITIWTLVAATCMPVAGDILGLVAATVL